MNPKIILTALAVLLLSLQAQAATQPEPIHKATFRGLAWDAPITDLNIYHGKKIVPITLLPNGRSGFYDYLGPDPILFFRQVTGTDGKILPQTSGSIPLSDFKQRTLLIFFGKPGQPNQYRVTAVDDSDAALPPGSFCFMNLSNTPLQVKCGPSQGSVDPAQFVTLSGTGVHEGSTIVMQIDAQSTKGESNHIYSSLLPFGKTNRSFVFISQPPGAAQFEVKRITEDAAMLPKPSPGKKKRRNAPSD